MSVSGRRRHHHRHSSRRTQEQRRTETQTLLLDATADALADLGWAGLSTTEVSRRAGVSRGAQQHHYPTKMVLVAAALEHLLEKLREEYQDAYDALPDERRNVSGALDLFWDTLRQPPAMALLELALAGRTDETLRELSAGLNERVVQIVREVFDELFPAALPEELAGTAIRALFALLVGLSLQNSLDHDAHGHQAAVMTQLKNFAELLISKNTGPKNSSSEETGSKDTSHLNEDPPVQDDEREPRDDHPPDHSNGSR
jgi:AcrR family transcriptional regulator